MRYVAGFMFSEDKEYVALIEKLKPDWQAGKLNGIGGKIEAHELPDEAMVREFQQEAGVVTKPKDWRWFCTLNHGPNIVEFYTTTGQLDLLTSPEEEQVTIIKVSYLDLHKHIPNLSWLIPLALDKDNLKAVVLDNSIPGENHAK